jgi:UDP-N-acetylglucosamine--N-acetylmuramyl-(pentapeptide) pyrophosphoryl-undecaprenol N-acetylglucosamine transferase
MLDVLLVGGGTAGHVIPAIATAQALVRSRPGIGVGFAGLADSLEQRLVTTAGYPFFVIDAVPLPRRATGELVRVAPRLFRAVRSARALLTETGAGTVVSFGGYVALPLSLAARRRVPVVLHEQNSRPGVANRIASRFAEHVAVTFAGSADQLAARRRVRITGNPVQERLRELDTTSRRSDARQRLDLEPTRTTLLVLGGSQGARSINSAVTGAATAWKALDIQIVHVTGHRGLDEALEWWRSQGVEPEDEEAGVRVVPFLDDMADAYAAADVVVSRAGATTIAELSVLGIPAVLVPYPHATAQHQRGNAEALERAGAATMLLDRDLTPDVVAAAVADIVSDTARAGRMAQAARAWARPEAAEALARLVLDVSGGTA